MKNSITPKLKKFLKEKHIYKEFKIHYLLYNKPFSIFSFTLPPSEYLKRQYKSYNDPMDIFGYAFSWNNSKLGFAFWSHINAEWKNNILS